MGVQKSALILAIGLVLLVLLILSVFIYRILSSHKPKEPEEFPFVLDIKEDQAAPDQPKDLQVEKITIRSKRLKRVEKLV